MTNIDEICKTAKLSEMESRVLRFRIYGKEKWELPFKGYIA